MPRARHVVNIDNDREDIIIAQLRNERRKRRIRTPSPQPMEAEVQDEVEFEGDYGLDVGQTQEQESHGRMPYSDSVLYKLDRLCRPWLIFYIRERKRRIKMHLRLPILCMG